MKKIEIKPIYGFCFFNLFNAVIPFLAPLLLLRGFSTKEILILFSVQTGTTLISEVPSGWFSDVIGRKKCLLLAVIWGILGWIFFIMGSSFFMFILSFICFGLKGSFLSGTLESVIYENSEDFKKDFAKIKQISLLGGILSALIGSLLYQNYYSLLVYLCLLANIISSFFLMKLKDSIKRDCSKKKESMITFFKNISLTQNNMGFWIIEGFLMGALIGSFCNLNMFSLLESKFPVYLNGVFVSIVMMTGMLASQFALKFHRMTLNDEVFLLFSRFFFQ